MLEQAISDLTAQVKELNRLMVLLVRDTADATEAVSGGAATLTPEKPARTRKTRAQAAANEATHENPTPTAPSAEPAAAVPATAPETPVSPASPSDRVIDPIEERDAHPVQPAAVAEKVDPARLRIELRACATRLASLVGRDNAIADISAALNAKNLAEVADDALPGAIQALENLIERARESVEEAA